MRLAWGLVAVALLTVAGKANAQPAPPSLLPRVALDYQVAPGLDCPSAEEVKAEAVKQIEGDPFSATGPIVGLFKIVVSPQGTEGIEIAVKFADVTGKRNFDTPFTGSPRTARTCAHLVRTHAIGEIVMEVIFQMSLRFRVQLASGGSSCSTPAACPVSRFDLWNGDWMRHFPKPTPDPEPPPPERWPTAVRLAATASTEAVASGWGSLGITAGGGYRYHSFSVSLEVHGDPSIATHQVVGRSVTFSRLSGAILACYHIQWFVGCAVGDAGAIFFPNHIAALPPATLLSDVGVHVALEFPLPILPPRLFFHVGANVMAPINPAQFNIMQTTIFQVAGPIWGVNFGPVLELPGW